MLLWKFVCSTCWLHLQGLEGVLCDLNTEVIQLQLSLYSLQNTHGITASFLKKEKKRGKPVSLSPDI